MNVCRSRSPGEVSRIRLDYATCRGGWGRRYGGAAFIVAISLERAPRSRRRRCDEAAEGESAGDDRGQQSLVVEDPLSVMGHLLDARQVGDELGEEEVGADEQAARSEEAEEVVEGGWHLLGVGVGEDQVVRAGELRQDVSGVAVDDADAVAVSGPRELGLGEADVAGVALDRLDESPGAVGEAERRVAEAAAELENTLRAYAGGKNGQKRTA